MEAMYRCLGKWEIADYCSAVAYLRTLPFVDGGKIGITGGSYGGYVAALAVASAPDLFSCGIAEFAVTDWALYDSVYTERYMDLPAENPEGYRQGIGALPRRRPTAAGCASPTAAWTTTSTCRTRCSCSTPCWTWEKRPSS